MSLNYVIDYFKTNGFTFSHAGKGIINLTASLGIGSQFNWYPNRFLHFFYTKKRILERKIHFILI